MIIIAAFIIGAVYGWTRAGGLRGNRADRLQYAIGFAMAFGILGLFLSVLIDRMT